MLNNRNQMNNFNSITYTEKYILYLTSKTEPSVEMNINKMYNLYGKEVDVSRIKTSNDILDLLSELGFKDVIEKFWLFEIQRVTYENKKVKGIDRSDIISKSILFRTRLDEYCFSLLDKI